MSYDSLEIPIVKINTEGFNPIDSKEEYIKGTFDFDSGDYNFEDFVKPIKIRGTSTFR